jgi:hypothetical protein
VVADAGTRAANAYASFNNLKEQMTMRMQAWTLKCGSRFACGAALAALLGACGQEASTTPSTDTASASDSASAYQALSASLKACDDKKEACITAAVADATKLAACDAAAVSCEDKTQAAASNAHKRLCDEAEDCVSKGRGGRGPGRVRGNDGHDEDGGVGDDVHTCIEHRAPSAPPCLKDLFTCLDATGLQQSSPQTQLDQAAKDAIVACVTTAHACIVDDMSSRRPGHSGGVGGAGGRPSFPGVGVGGRGHRDEAGSDAAGSSAQSPWGQGPGKGQGVAGHGFGGAPWTHDEAGSDADDDDNKGPGQAGAGGRRRGGRGGAGGAAGN